MEIEKEELWRIDEDFEERLKKFIKVIDDDNLMHIILKAHLYIEHELNEILKMNIKHPQRLPKMNFAMKQKLVFAMDLIPQDEFNVIKHFNGIRNAFAHNIEYEFNEKVLKEKIIDQFGKRTKKSYNTRLVFFEKDGLKGNLRCALFTIWEILVEIRVIPDHVRRI